MSSHEDPMSDFAQLVQDDIKNEISDERAEELRASENGQDWYDELISIINKVDAQLSSSKAERSRRHKEYMDYVASRQEWRAGALGFRRIALERLSEARQVLRDTDEPIEVVRLTNAIKHHKETVDGDKPQADAEGADHKLWATIEE